MKRSSLGDAYLEVSVIDLLGPLRVIIRVARWEGFRFSHSGICTGGL